MNTLCIELVAIEAVYPPFVIARLGCLPGRVFRHRTLALQTRSRKSVIHRVSEDINAVGRTARLVAPMIVEEVRPTLSALPPARYGRCAGRSDKRFPQGERRASGRTIPERWSRANLDPDDEVVALVKRYRFDDRHHYDRRREHHYAQHAYAVRKVTRGLAIGM
jgi:hypothetical protein